MSWNVSTRLNNLQQQINNIANKGLTNPLEQIMDANSYTIENINILDGGTNSIEIKTSNINGVQIDSNLNVDADITCDTLNYTTLNPPINTGGISFNIVGGDVTETTPSNFTITQYNPYNGIITTTKILNPSAILSLNFSSPSASNSIAIGVTTANDASGGFLGIETGVFWYPSENYIYQITNGQQTSNSYSYTNQTDLTLEMKIIDGTLKIYVNNTEATILEQSLNGLYYFTVTCYMASTVTTSINNLVVGQSYSETLEQILLNGNSAFGQDIDDVGTLSCENMTTTGNISLLYGDGTLTGSNFQLFATSNDDLKIQQYKNGNSYNQAFTIQDKDYIQLQSNNILYTQDGLTNGYILDSSFTLPLYKQFYNNISGTVTSSLSTPSNIFLFSIPVYPATQNISYNYGITNVDITFTNLQLVFSTVSATSPSSNFNTSQIATLYLTDTEGILTPSNSNSIVIKMISPSGTATNSVEFISTVPIILWNSTVTNKTKVYLNVLISGIPPVGVSNYQVNMTSSNFMVNSYVSKSQGGSITFGQ